MLLDFLKFLVIVEVGLLIELPEGFQILLGVLFD
jgi:hypothetical protein